MATNDNYGGYWYNENDNSMTFCVLTPTASADRALYYPSLYKIDLATNIKYQIYPTANEDLSLLVIPSFIDIDRYERPSISFNDDTKLYNVSFLSFTADGASYIHSMDFVEVSKYKAVLSDTPLIHTLTTAAVALVPPLTGTLEVRSSEGTATICGWNEYGTVSTPPRKYRTQSYDEDFLFCNWSSPDCPLSDSNGFTRNYVSLATSVYGVSSCSKTIIGVRQYGGVVVHACPYGNIPGFTTTDGVHGADIDMSSVPSVVLFTPFSVTKTNLVYIPNGQCYNQEGGGSGYATSGLKHWALSNEDTEQDATNRLMSTVSASGWTEDTELVVARYQARTGFSFFIKKVEFRFTLSGLYANTDFTVSIDAYRRAYGSSDSFVLYQTLEYVITSDNLGVITFTDDVPNDPGYETYIIGGTVQP